METIYYISNVLYENRAFCSLDHVWINDGRDTANFKTEEEARRVLEDCISDDEKEYCRVCSFSFEGEFIEEI